MKPKHKLYEGLGHKDIRDAQGSKEIERKLPVAFFNDSGDAVFDSSQYPSRSLRHCAQQRRVGIIGARLQWSSASVFHGVNQGKSNKK